MIDARKTGASEAAMLERDIEGETTVEERGGVSLFLNPREEAELLEEDEERGVDTIDRGDAAEVQDAMSSRDIRDF